MLYTAAYAHATSRTTGESMSRMAGLVVALMVLLNVGEAINIIFAIGKHEWWALLTALGWMVALNLVGFWLLRGLRDEE